MAPRTARGTGFTTLEDIALVKAWAVATRETIDQNATTLWPRVCEVLNENLLTCKNLKP